MENIESKISNFSALPSDRLSSVGQSENKKETISVDKEFFQTNEHTKQTHQETPIDRQSTPSDQSINDTLDTGKKKTKLGSVVKGSMPVNLIDMVIPSVVVLIIHYIGYEISKTDLQLSKQEKEDIAPAVQECLDSIDIDFSNPWVNLSIILGLAYGSKIVDKIPELKKRKIEKVKAPEMSIVETIHEAISGNDTETPAIQFNKEYMTFVERLKNERRKGIGESKMYIANNYRDELIAMAAKFGLSEHDIEDKLNYVHVAKPNAGKKKSEFKLD